MLNFFLLRWGLINLFYPGWSGIVIFTISAFHKVCGDKLVPQHPGIVEISSHKLFDQAGLELQSFQSQHPRELALQV
jgi:hypothetical protein